jgi:hypothetical protein
MVDFLYLLGFLKPLLSALGQTGMAAEESEPKPQSIDY